MSGGGKSRKKEEQATTTSQQPQTRTFGGGLDPRVVAQLQAGGLLGIMPQQSPFQSVTVPILSRPDELEAYLKSIGKTPTTASGDVSKTGGSQPFVKLGSI